MKRIIIIVIISSFINSCDLVAPDSSKPIYNTINEINVVNVDGTNHKVLKEGWFSNIVYGKDKILFFKNYSLYSIKFDGSELKEIKNFNKIVWDYSISRDGEKIILSIYENSYANLYLMNSDGSNLVRLTNVNHSELEPHFSFDLNKIVFRRGWNICKINSSGSSFELIRIHPDSSVYRNPHFLSDDNRIIYFEENIKYFSDSTTLHLYDLNSNKDSTLMICRNHTYYNPYLDVAPGERILFFQGYGFGVDSLTIIDFKNNIIRSIDKAYYGSFSFDGDQIIYSDLKTIYINNSEGDDKRIIYEEKDEKKSISKPRLSSDKQTVIFETSYSVLAN